MQRRATYATKKVQFAQEVDLANIEAQRAYTKIRQQMNNARSLAILENQEDFKKMLETEGMVEVRAAERGVRGRSVARALLQNQQNFGLSQAMRSRGLINAGYMARQSNDSIKQQLKSLLNRSYSKVAVQPVADIAPPPPVMQNVGMTLMLGMGQALGEGIMGNEGLMDKWNNGGNSGGDSGGSGGGTDQTNYTNHYSFVPAQQFQSYASGW